MENISFSQIRQFRLHSHYLDTWYPAAASEEVAGACGFQNSPPGAWESALHNRIDHVQADECTRMLEGERTLLQAWSFRGAPVVFPTAQSAVFLSALAAKEGEPWIYTRGIQLALDYLQMDFGDALRCLQAVIPLLDNVTIQSKTALDQTLAEWMTPLLPQDKQGVWNHPSMYGNPEKQTVGGAVVSFLLRPCALMGLVVFGRREGSSPTFTSFQRWLGHPLRAEGTPERNLVRKYLHCYGPATPRGFADWLGCSARQAARIWQAAGEEIEPVRVSGRERFLLSADRELLANPPPPKRTAHLLGGHDPYLGLRDREVILEEPARQKRIWQTVSNPGAVLWQGKIAGFWKAKKRGDNLEMEVTMWDSAAELRQEVVRCSEEYAAKRGCKLNRFALFP